jgi:tetratricopeptide (TPR) repeat protein
VTFTLGMELLGRGDLPGAEAAFGQALVANPRNAKAHLFLATCLLRRAESGAGGEELYKQTLAAADQALALQGDLAYAHLTRARALRHLARSEDALAALREAVLRGPEFAEMHQALGEALAERGQMGEALRELEDAVRLAKPGDAGPERALRKWRDKAAKQR